MRGSVQRFQPSSHRRWLDRATPYLFLAPFLIFFAVFTLYPFILGFRLSLTEWTGFGDPSPVGLKNYENLMTNKSFHRSLRNTAWIAVAAIILIVPLALACASALNSKRVAFRAGFRAVFFLPIGTPLVVIAMVFIVLFDEHYGAINWVFESVGIPRVDFLGEKKFVKPGILLVLVWQWTAVPMIYFLAGLQGVPQSLYDAAVVDGARKWSTFRNVTAPHLRPIIVLVLVLLTNDAIRLFDQVYVLTFFSGAPGSASGGPGEAGLTVVLYLYRVAFRSRHFGLGSAVGVMILAMAFAVAFIQLQFTGSLKSSEERK